MKNDSMKKYSRLTVEAQIKKLQEGTGYYLNPPSRNLEPRVNDNIIDPRTSSVNPSTQKPTEPDPGLSGVSLGRGNPSDRSGGPNVPPRLPGLQNPAPGQVGGSNSPQSGIRQMGSALTQEPGNLGQRFIGIVERNLAPQEEPTKSNALDSDLIQPLPASHIHANTRLQRSREGHAK